jgi:hypothetical protein
VSVPRSVSVASAVSDGGAVSRGPESPVSEAPVSWVTNGAAESAVPPAPGSPVARVPPVSAAPPVSAKPPDSPVSPEPAVSPRAVSPEAPVSPPAVSPAVSLAAVSLAAVSPPYAPVSPLAVSAPAESAVVSPRAVSPEGPEAPVPPMDPPVEVAAPLSSPVPPKRALSPRRLSVVANESRRPPTEVSAVSRAEAVSAVCTTTDRVSPRACVSTTTTGSEPLSAPVSTRPVSARPRSVSRSAPGSVSHTGTIPLPSKGSAVSAVGSGGTTGTSVSTAPGGPPRRPLPPHQPSAHPASTSIAASPIVRMSDLPSPPKVGRTGTADHSFSRTPGTPPVMP